MLVPWFLIRRCEMRRQTSEVIVTRRSAMLSHGFLDLKESTHTGAKRKDKRKSKEVVLLVCFSFL